MNEKLIATILIAGILVIGGYLYMVSGAEVSAQGNAEIEAIPDQASIYIMIEARNESAQAAQNQHDLIKDELLTDLIKLGLEMEDIQTSYYNVEPEYDWSDGSRKQIGFVGREQIVISVQDFDDVASIVDAAIDSGAYVSGIHFELSQEKQNEYKALALEEAGKDARNKAQATAEGLGKSLGRLISVQSQDFNYYPRVYYEASVGSMDASEAREVAATITPRDVEVRASVVVKYKLSLF